MFCCVCHCDSSSPGPRDNRRSAGDWWVCGDFYKKNTTQSRLQLHIWVWVTLSASLWTFCLHYGTGKKINSNIAEEKQSRAGGQGKFVAEEFTGPAVTMGTAPVSSGTCLCCWDMSRWSRQAAEEGLLRKITLEIPQWWLAPVFHLGYFSSGPSSWVVVCPADPWVLSSHIPVLASCCSLTKPNPPLKVPDALGPHTCLAPPGTCSPCPAPAAPALHLL